jgi:hypothetical protein
VAVTFVAASTGQTAATKIDTAITATPPSTAVNDVIFAWVDAVNATDPALAGPAGWTLVGSNNDPGTPTVWTYLWSRVVQAGDSTTPSFASTNATTFNGVIIMSAYHGVDTTTPVLTSAFGVQVATSTSKVTDPITTAQSAWIVSGFADKTAGVNYSAFSHTVRGQLRQTTTGIPSAALQDSNGNIAAASGITQSATGPSSSVGTSFILAIKAATRATLMPTGTTDTFTGTNGAAVSTTNWNNIKADNGGAATIQSNGARLRTGATIGNRTSIRLNGGTRTDAEIDFVVTIPAASPALYAAAWLRTQQFVDTQNGYYFTLEPGQLVFGKSDASYARTDLVTYTTSFVAGDVVHVRCAVFGNTMKARAWLQSLPEPTSTWNINTTNSDQPSAGYIGVTIVSGTSGAKDLLLDDFSAWDTETPSQAVIVVGGSVTPTGALNKKTFKTFTGSSTPTGVLTKVRVVIRTFTGAVTPTGALAKKTIKSFAGSSTPTGILAKRPNKKFTGTVTPTGTLAKKVYKKFVGAVTPVGTLLTQTFGRIFGRPGIVVVTHRVVGTVRARIRRG